MSLGIEDVRGKKQRRNDAFVAKETGRSEPRSLVPSEGGKSRNRRGSVVEFAMVVRSVVSLIVSFALRQAQRDAVIAIGNTSSGVYNPDVLP
ncbi:hypothetical protein PSHT_09265 [Puccinia striiformis]|uniref:Uncharacterized protein n=1 Tax=Puccinia striiformis TaxID=27350 RepID=A0A2S4VI75_9BASI|nr:hypothetical protein PSHT_09265 [Puccinia striiformis]